MIQMIQKKKYWQLPEVFKFAAPLSRVAKTLADFRHTLFTSDIAERTRGTLPNIFVKIMYGITVTYIGSDLYFKYISYTPTKELNFTTDLWN